MWPQGMLARVSWIIVAGALTLLVTMHTYHIHDRLLTSATALATSTAERLASIDHLLLQSEMDDATLLRAFNGPEFQIRIEPNMPANTHRRWPHTDEVRGAVSTTLAHLSPRPFALEFNTDRDEGRPRTRMNMGLQRADGRWLVAQSDSGVLESTWTSLALSWNLLFVVIVLGVMLWLARGSLRQLPRFVAAAEQLGSDTDNTPLDEHAGPKEVRRLAAAFNATHARIAEHLEERTNMLAAVSHDLRTFLTRLELRTDFIAEPEQLERARRDIAEMTALLDSVLAFAREDRADEATVAVDLPSLLQRLVNDAGDLGHDAHYDGPTHLSIVARPIALKRAFTNLIDNAIRYGAGAEVALARTNGLIRIEISDRGPGIPEEARARVLKPFTRLETSRNRETGGNGLGLAIANAVVRRHGGALTLLDRVGGGLTVRVDLPAVVM